MGIGVLWKYILTVGEVLPTKADFDKIAATLQLDEETQKRLWQQAFL